MTEHTSNPADSPDSRLEPCPFCGGEPLKVPQILAGDGDRWQVWSACCGLECGRGPARGSSDEAAAAWNRRAALGTTGADVEPVAWISEDMLARLRSGVRGLQVTLGSEPSISRVVPIYATPVTPPRGDAESEDCGGGCVLPAGHREPCHAPIQPHESAYPTALPHEIRAPVVAETEALEAFGRLVADAEMGTRHISPAYRADFNRDVATVHDFLVAALSRPTSPGGKV